MLNRLMHDFIGEAVYGGRTEPYEQIFEPTYRGRRVGRLRRDGGVDWTNTLYGEMLDRDRPQQLGALLEQGFTDFDPDGLEWDVLYDHCTTS